MNIHLLVDYTFLYYKYTFALKDGRMQKLSADVDMQIADGEVKEKDKDISQIYYSIREVESFRKDYESKGHNVTVSVCFDMKSKRKMIAEGASDAEVEAVEGYKDNRPNKLVDSDFENIQIVERLLQDAGYNTYRYYGFEADDIIAHLTDKYADDFDYNIIITPDADLLVNINDKVGATRYKTRKGYKNVFKENYESYLSEELKCRIPYNALTLFKSTCGDSSDGIKGISRFGPKAFDKLVDYCEQELDVKWDTCGTFESTEAILNKCRETGYLSDDKVDQAMIGLSLVRPLLFENGEDLHKPTSVSTRELREKSYMRLNMRSLID